MTDEEIAQLTRRLAHAERVIQDVQYHSTALLHDHRSRVRGERMQAACFDYWLTEYHGQPSMLPPVDYLTGAPLTDLPPVPHREGGVMDG
jgi:hypothetical protein